MTSHGKKSAQAKRSVSDKSKTPLLRVLILHGPNLNMLGVREPSIYGALSLNDINSRLKNLGEEIGALVDIFQSNHEGELIEKIHSACGKYQAVIINAGAYTHTSIAIRDALLAVQLPVFEVHLSNVHKREEFRQRSFISDIAEGIIMGFGALSYELALRAVVECVRSHSGRINIK